MLEPIDEQGAVRPRNRFHYPPEVPQALLGSARDPELYLRDHPALRARRNAAALRATELAISIDSAGRDALHAHDGAEYLHRVLWDLDVRHEYRLRRDADHVGPELIERLHEAFAWVGHKLTPPPRAPLTEQELAWQAWLDGTGGTEHPAAPLAPTSPLFPRFLRAQLAPLRAAALREDPSCARNYGLLVETRAACGPVRSA